MNAMKIVPARPANGARQWASTKTPAADERADDADDDVADEAVAGAAHDERREHTSDETDDDPGEDVHDLPRSIARASVTLRRASRCCVRRAHPCVLASPPCARATLRACRTASRIALVVAATAATATPARADGFGLGVFLGEPTGLDLFIDLRHRSALDIVLGIDTLDSNAPRLRPT